MKKLLRDIEKTRAERLQAQMFIAQTMAPPSEEEESLPENGNISNAQSEMKAEFNTSMDGAEAARQIKRTLKRETNDI